MINREGIGFGNNLRDWQTVSLKTYVETLKANSIQLQDEVETLKANNIQLQDEKAPTAYSYKMRVETLKANNIQL